MNKNPNLKKVLSLASQTGDLNDYTEITDELIFWALDYSDCSAFYWLGDACGSTQFGKFLKEHLPKGFKRPEFSDDITDTNPLPMATSVLMDLKNAKRVSRVISDDEINPETFIYASFLRKGSLLRKFFSEFCPASQQSREILKNYLLSDSTRHDTISPHDSLSAHSDGSQLLEEDIGKMMGSLGASTFSKKPKSYLEKYCRNLNTVASEGKIDAIVGRDRETSAAVTILCRRNKNNPVLVGEAGVGKTAIAENLALKIVSQECNPLLWDKVVYELKMSSIISDSTLRGQFEERLEGIIKEACKFSNVILYIDELHTLVGAGSGGQSQLDASNMIKPHLARGELMILGSTTMDEYRKYIRIDKALDRRFQKVIVQEPSSQECVEILMGILSDYEDYHGVEFPIDLVEKVVELSDRFVPNKNFPDKAIDILDETCSFVKARHWEYPEKLKALNEKVSLIGSPDLIDDKEGAAIMKEYETAIDDWTDRIGSPPSICEDDIYNLFFQKFNISRALLNRDKKDGLQSLEPNLKAATFGQDAAVKEICTTIKRKHIGLSPSSKGSMVSFLFTGPKGCGKEHLARKLSSLLFSGSETFYYFNCTAISSETVIEALNKGMFCTLYFDNFDPKDDTYKKYFENMISEGYVLDKVGGRVWCKHCNVILSSVSNEGPNAAIGFGDKDGALDKKEAPFVDKIIRLKKVDTDTIKEVAVKRSVKVLENISSKFSNVKVDFSEDILAAAILDFLGEDITLDTLDSEISEFLSEKLCDSLVELSSSGGILYVDKLLTKVSK
jgi:ATP-dependent Clp protease ATP-binding subunit ClpA